MSDLSQQIANLSPKKRELFLQRLNKKKEDVFLQKQIKFQGRKSNCFPLSFAQQMLWILDQLQPGNSAHHIPIILRLTGSLNIAALLQTFNEIISRHEALRSNFQTFEGQPIAVISEEKPITLSIFDISDLAENQQQAEIKQQAAQEAQQPFDISNDHLLRVKLLRLGEEEHIVLLTIHHIVFDGWSIGVLVEELAKLYQAFCNGQPSPLPTLPIQYVDFAVWQRQWLQGEVLKSQISYWRKQLENAPRVLELPTDYPRPAVQTYRGATYSFELSKELSVSLNKLSQQQGSTLFMTLLAGFQILLWRYTGQQDIVVGSPIANRNREEIEELIGFFVNTLVLRTNLAGNPSFEELLKQVREVALGAYAHQDLPFELLVEQLQPQRDLSHTPLFQVMFVLQNAPMPALELPGLTLTQLESDSGSVPFDLTLTMTETESGLVGSFEYSTDLFAQSSIHRMVGHLQTLLEAIVANPQQRLSDLPLLTGVEQNQLLQEWNNIEIEYPQDKCIHELFEAQVEKTPDAIAVVFENQQLSYRELNRRANQLAHYLRSAKLSRSDSLGVKPEVLVGICVERSLEMSIAILGILKAGAAYVPIDVNYPKERIEYILEDAQVEILLTQQHLEVELPKHQASLLYLERNWSDIAQQSTQNCRSQVTSENLAYVIYTSGSTGKPKGVAVNHQALVNYTLEIAEQFQLQKSDRFLQFASIGFDVVVEELFPTWIKGATVVLLENKELISCSEFQQLINKQQLTVFELPTAYWHQWVSELASNQDQVPSCVRFAIVGGERISAERLRQWQQWQTPLVHVYGLTETTVTSTLYHLNSEIEALDIGNSLSIGRAIANTQIYLLDSHLQPVPVGVAGEIYIGGAGIARGYINRAELTALRFIPNPFSTKPGSRLYKTGDLARYLKNGEIEYIGRIDHQVKLRGFRIELGEIEAVLNQHPEVRECVAIDREDIPGQKRLVAYLVPEKSGELAIAKVRSFLKRQLPDYMIPSAFVELKTLPLTSNGKIDRKALPTPDNIRPQLEAVYQPPQTEIEQTIADIWQKLLKLEDVGMHDNFFELGGHSLLLVQVHSKLLELLKRDLSLLDLFRYPTINSLANYFNQMENQQPSHDIMAGMDERIADGKAQQRKRLQRIKSV
ncbi:MAG: amino acid adenylation domain-containing protein [Pelatocladus maniniholoensis HA4357-MV3]|jgi:amino acid adenylation domain-containing protein|uniref:Amino acid adenylation domain-containing protein n=1 Tax=Pelatocladus maniniholoensis HA4357-MV3 TaxID=1117104 RepID=A0A9E3LSM1_9NOST|nr:amino acid adenylation domain-containing protein [Pelatocladus maniniholoensis HA4357-MV3]